MSAAGTGKRRRPDLPQGTQWPEGDYGDAPEARRKSGDGLIAYLERVWLPILEAGRRDGKIYVDRRVIADWYPGVIVAIKNYRKRNRPDHAPREIPEHLRFPTLAEVNDLAIAKGTVALEDLGRLGRAAQRRRLKGIVLKTPP